MWLKIALVAAILWQCSCEVLDCNDMFPDTLYGELECIQEEIESENKGDTLDARNITWKVVNKNSGTVSVEFNLMPKSSGYKSYRLKLYMDEKVRDAEKCANVTDRHPLHSTRYVTTRAAGYKTKVSSCGRTATVMFNYIFTGCYMLEIAAKVNRHSLPRVFSSSLPKFLETEYKKDLLIKKAPGIISQYTTALRALDCSVNNITRINVTRMDLEIRKCEFQSCTCGNGIKQLWWEIALSASGQFMCKVKGSMTDKPICHIASDEIHCTIPNVTTGFYCVMVEIVDDRCERDTVWNNNSYCLYNNKVFEVQSTSPQPAQPLPLPPQAHLDFILAAVFAVLLLVCLFVLLFIWRSKRRQNSEPGQSPYAENQTLPCRPRILLLYSRDCKPFMNMMATFREMLKQVTKCEVYDCFDPFVEEDLCQSKTDWLLTHITSPEVKVVVIESKCAALHQMALIQHMKIVYKEPTWLDDLFLYGLRILSEDLQKNTYGRIFVVRIHGFTEESDNLCHITPYTRYVVPQNTEKLLSSLYQQSSLEYVLILNEDTDSSIQKLQEDIRTLEIFKQQNRDYLNELIQRSIK